MKKKRLYRCLGTRLLGDSMIFRASHNEEVALALRHKLVLNLPDKFARIQKQDLQIIMAIHSKRLESTQMMVDHVDRKARIKGPNMHSVRVDLGVEHKVVAPRLRLILAPSDTSFTL